MSVQKENFKILPAKRKNRLEMKSINEQCLPENYDVSIWEYFLEYHTSYVLTSNSTVVGYCLCGEKEDDRETASIISFAILPSYRNKKLGEKILSKTIENLKNHRQYKHVQLQVRVSNSIAISLYKKLGFFVASVLERYYEDGENAFEMTKKLK